MLPMCQEREISFFKNATNVPRTRDFVFQKCYQCADDEKFSFSLGQFVCHKISEFILLQSNQ